MSSDSSDDEFFDAQSDASVNSSGFSKLRLAGRIDDVNAGGPEQTADGSGNEPNDPPSAIQSEPEPAVGAVAETSVAAAASADIAAAPEQSTSGISSAPNTGTVNASSGGGCGEEGVRNTTPVASPVLTDSGNMNNGSCVAAGVGAGSDQPDGAVMSAVRHFVQPECSNEDQTQEALARGSAAATPSAGTSSLPQANATGLSSEPACTKPPPGKRPPPRPAPFATSSYAKTRQGGQPSGASPAVQVNTVTIPPKSATPDPGRGPQGTVSTQGEATQSQNTTEEDDFISRYAEMLSHTDSTHGNFVAADDDEPATVSPVQSEAALDDKSDTEILEGIFVKNLDTGESIPLSEAEQLIPNGVNPLALHIMRLTSEYVGEGSDPEDVTASEKAAHAAALQAEAAAKLVKQKGKLAFKAIRGKVKSVKKALEAHGDHDAEMDAENNDGVRFKPSSHRGPPYEFDNLTLRQDLSHEHSGPVWTLRFSTDGRLMASAGQDLIVRVWVLKKAKKTFEDMRNKYAAKEGEGGDSARAVPDRPPSDDDAFFDPKPFCSYSGHTADILDLAWSKNYFLLSASFDKTVRLWHVSRQECLACFQHTEFVTGIAFHPRDDRYFLSGSLDARLRLWNIPDKKVALWNEVEGSGNRLITAAGFVQNGKYAAAGTYDGRCLLYETEYLKYHTQIHVRSSRGKNAKGRKITGIVPMPGEDKILISSNDSRVRLYDLKDLSMVCKYKGAVNRSSQIEASFSSDGSHIISGSENGFVYLWRTFQDFSRSAAARRDVNDVFESFAAPVSCQSGDQGTAAVFAPVPGLFAGEGISQNQEVLVAADYKGCIHVYSAPARTDDAPSVKPH